MIGSNFAVVPASTPAKSFEPVRWGATTGSSRPTGLAEAMLPSLPSWGEGTSVGAAVSEEFAALPEEVWRIEGQIGERVYLVRPLQVRIQWESTGVVAEADELLIHTFGDNREEALYSLFERLVEEYDRLIRSGVKLSPKLQRVADSLRKAVWVEGADKH